jgi:hypothetical protein
MKSKIIDLPVCGFVGTVGFVCGVARLVNSSLLSELESSSSGWFSFVTVSFKVLSLQASFNESMTVL